MSNGRHVLYIAMMICCLSWYIGFPSTKWILVCLCILTMVYTVRRMLTEAGEMSWKPAVAYSLICLVPSIVPGLLPIGFNTAGILGVSGGLFASAVVHDLVVRVIRRNQGEQTPSAGLTVIILMIGICIIILPPVMAVQRADSVTRAFITHVSHGQLSQAYALTSREYRRQCGRTMFNTICTEYQRRQGKLMDLELLSKSVLDDGSGSSYCVEYKTLAMKQSEHVTVKIKRLDWTFKVQEFSYRAAP